MYEERYPYYMKYSDICIDNNESLNLTLEKLVEVVHEDISY